MNRPTITRSLWSFLLLAGVLQTYGQGPVITLTPSDYNGFQVSCFGLKDGAIDATVTGGTEPYSYAWSNGASTEDLANVPAGYYVLRVSDANSNTTSLDITLDQPMPLKIAVEPFKYPSGLNISCHECFNGSIDVTVYEGVPPYTYDWGDEVFSQDRSGLGAMNYQVAVTDANGCNAKSEPMFLTQPERSDWTMEGNANTIPGTHFFGTTDAKDVVFKSNGVERLRLTSGGQMKILGLGGTGVLGIDADGVLGPVPGIGLNPINPLPCAQDIFPFWRTGGNELTTCDPSRAVLGSLDARHVNFITNNDVRMRLTSAGQLQVGGDLEEWPETDAAGRVNILQGNGNWLVLKTQGATPSTPSSYWGLHNPPEQDRLMFYFHPVQGEPLYDVLTLREDGNVGIGTSAASTAGMRLNVVGGVQTDKLAIGNVTAPSGYRLYVQDGILTEKVKVSLSSTSDWSDHVFAPGYGLMPLAEVGDFIEANGHLPGVPSAECMVEEGLDVVKSDALLLQKIEELTLHLIKMEERIALLEVVNQLLKQNK